MSIKFDQIIRKNIETYYRFDNGVRLNIWPRYFAIFFVSGVLSYVCTNISGNLLQTIVSALAILVGFSFTVQFFLFKPDVFEFDNESLEDLSKFKRLKKLSVEIFDNVSYFNMICFLGICLCVLLLIEIDSSVWPLNIISRQTFNSMQNAISGFAKFLLFFACVEAVMTFLRLLGRINFLFQQVRPHD